MSIRPSQGPHDSSTRPQNLHRPFEPPHYTAFGFSRIDDDSSVARFIEYWFIHAYIDEHEIVTGVRFERSSNKRRFLTTGEMRFLCVSCCYYFSARNTIDPF